jgi:O-succinylbenzoic acid--CoA ligase
MMLVRAIVGGLNLITVEPKANPFENLKGKIDFAAITPYQLNHSISSLQSLNVQKIIVGGSAVSKQLESQLETLNTAFFETYGMTETASHIALRALNGSSKSDYFKTLNGVAIQKDNRNCLIIQAPLLIEEEIKTNDIVEIKDQNTFHWIGRFDSVINSGGVKMHPEEIEKKIEHLIQSQFFISSIPDELLGNKVILVIESKTFENKDEQILIQNIKRVVEKYEAPNLILYLDQFIYSKNNKVLKTETQRQAIKLTEDKAQKK